MSDPTSLAQALAKLDEAMRPALGGSHDPARRRAAQRLAVLARCEDEDLAAFAKRHLPGRTVEEAGLRAGRDLLLAIGAIADMEEGGADAWAALAEVKGLLERRLSEAKEAAQKRKAEAENGGAGEGERVAEVVPPSRVAPVSLPPVTAPLPVYPAAPVAVQEMGHAEDYSALQDSDVEETVAFGPLVLTGSALPFGPSAAPVPTATAGPAPRVAEPPTAEAEPDEDEDPCATTGRVRALKGPVLPFQPSGGGHEARPSPPPVEAAPRAEPPGGLSVAQYAALCAELTVFPGETDRTFRRYGLDSDEKRSAVDAGWRERLRHDPAEYETWQKLYWHYHAHWAKQREGGSPGH